MGWNEAYAVRMSGLKNGTHVDVLEALAAIYNVKEKRLFPSTEYIAQVARVSPNVVRKTIKALEAQGLLSVRQNPGCIRYFILHLDALPPPLQAPKKKRMEPLAEVTPLSEVEGDPFQKCEGTPYRSERGPLTEVTPELMNLTNERTNERFFVESPSGDFDDAPPTLFDDETTEKVERSASRIPACPYKKLVDLYHEVCPMLPTVTVLTPGRKTQLKARWTEIYREEHCTSEAECLENFRFIFNRVAASRFLTGRTDPGPNRSRPFVANLDWLIKAANFVKVCENRYSN